VYTGTAKAFPERSRQRRGGFPEDYLSIVRSMPAMRVSSASGSADIDYLAKVPYRSIGR
jgi:phycobilisome rod-core linker protein